MQTIKQRLLGVPDALARLELLQAFFSLFSNQVVAPPTLAIKAAGGVLARTTTACFALVGGVLVKIAANTDMPALTGVSIPNGSKQIVGFATDAAGTLSLLAGNVAATVGALQFPAVPVGQVALGYLIIENGTGSTFTGGTTALDAASLTVTYANMVDGLSPLTVL